MNRLLSLFIAVAVAGCSNIATVSNEPLSGPRSSQPAITSSGGPFTGAFSGEETGGSTCSLNEPFKFSGTGSATFIHASSETGSVVWKTGFTCHLTGFATLKSIRHPRNSITFFLQGQTQGCNPRSGLQFRVTSGTGRFAHATGNGILHFLCQSSGSYTDQWTGTLQF